MSLQVWLPLTEDLHNQGISNTSIINSGTTLASSGKLGGCRSFTSGNYIGFDGSSVNNFKIATNLSISCWINFSATDSSERYIVCCYETGGAGFCWQNQKINWQIYANSGYRACWSASTVSLNVWHHIVGTYDNRYLKLYIDGVLSNTLDLGSTYSITYNSTTPWEIGGNPGPGSFASGNLTAKINDFRLYDHCLSLQEVRDLAKGLVLHYPLNNGYIESTVNCIKYPTPGDPVGSCGWDTTKHVDAIKVSNWGYGYNGGVTDPSTGYHACWKLIDNIPTIVFQDKNSEVSHTHRWLGISGGGLTTSQIYAGIIYTVSFDAKADVSGKYVACGLYYKKTSDGSNGFHDGCPQISITQDWRRYSYTFTCSQMYSISSFYFYGHYGTEGTSYVRNIQIEIKSHDTPYTPSSRSENIIYDASGNGYNGTVSGSLAINDGSIRYNSCVFWPTATSAANTIHSPTIYQSGEAITLNIWIKTTTVGGNSYQMPFESNSRCYCEMSITSSGQLRGGLYVNGTRYVTNVGSGLLDGKWHMITITYDGKTIKRYVDAVSLGDTSITGTLNNTSQSYWLGVLGTDTSYYNSNIYESDARLYATALSAADIQDLYNAPIKIANNGTLITNGEVVE